MVWLFLALLLLVPSFAFGQQISCANKPSGSTTITNNPMTSASFTGWGFNPNTLQSFVSNQNDPTSPPGALQNFYPVGHPGGNGVGNTFYHASTGRQAIFTCFWMKLDTPFENHKSAGTKIHYFVGPGGNGHPYYLLMRNHNAPYALWVVNQAAGHVDNRHLGSNICFFEGTCNLPPNAGSSPIQLDTWVKFEIFLRHSTSLTARDGIARWWVNGTLAGNYDPANGNGLNTDIQYQFAGVDINPVFGGANDQTKQQQDFMWIGHFEIADPGGGTVSPPPPPPPPPPPVPAAPSDLRFGFLGDLYAWLRWLNG